MSIRTNKRDVLTSIGAYTSLARERDLPVGNDTLSSLDENKNPLKFLLDILRVTMGSNAIRTLIGEFFVNAKDIFEPAIKEALIRQLIGVNHNDILQEEFEEFVDNGIDVPIKNIDPFNVFKVNPQSSVGDLLYGKNQDNFNHAVFNAIMKDGDDEYYGNIIMNFNSTTEELNIRPINGNQNVGNFYTNYIDNAELIERDVFSLKILDLFFGSVTYKMDKSVEEIYEEKKLEKKINNLIDKSLEDSATSEAFNIENDLIAIYNQSVDLKRGVRKVFMGCEIIDVPETFETIEENLEFLVSESNPNKISSRLDELIINSSTRSGISEKNKNSLLDGAYDNIMEFTKLELIKATILSPEILLLFHISNTIKNDMMYESVDMNDFLSDNINLLECLIKDLLNELNKLIFNLVIEELKNIIRPIISTILKEKITQYIRLLKSLVR